jgi:uncharacterized membrane protein
MMSSKKRRWQSNNPPSTSTPAHKINSQSQQIRSLFYQGPLPPASELQRYEQVRAEFGERIMQMAERQLAMAESQMKHRQAIETRVITTNVRLSYLGLVSGFVLGAGGLCAAVYLIRLGRELGGGAAFIASLATLAGLFIYGRKRQEKQLNQKVQRNQG